MLTIKMLQPLLPPTLNLEIFEHTEIGIEYYWNETFTVFVDCFQLIRTFTDRYTMIKVDGQNREQQLTKVKKGNPGLQGAPW